MILITIILSTILSVEIILKFSLIETARNLQFITKKSAKILLSKNISDHWKEKALAAYSQKMFLISIKFSLILVVVSAVIALPLLALVKASDILSILMRWDILALICAISTLHFYIRKRYGK